MTATTEETVPPEWTDSLIAEDIPPIAPGPAPDHHASRRGRAAKPGSGRALFQRARAGEHAADAPPPTRQRKTRTRTKSTVDVPRRKGMFVEPLTRYYTFAGMGVAMRKPQTGATIVAQAEACAKAWDELAYNNEAVRRALFMAMQSGQMGALFMAHLPIMFALIMEGDSKIKHAFDAMGEGMLSTLMEQMVAAPSTEDTAD